MDSNKTDQLQKNRNDYRKTLLKLREAFIEKNWILEKHRSIPYIKRKISKYQNNLESPTEFSEYMLDCDVRIIPQILSYEDTFISQETVKSRIPKSHIRLHFHGNRTFINIMNEYDEEIRKWPSAGKLSFIKEKGDEIFNDIEGDTYQNSMCVFTINRLLQSLNLDELAKNDSVRWFNEYISQGKDYPSISYPINNPENILEEQGIILNPAQMKSFLRIIDSNPHIISGFSGSGKTEVLFQSLNVLSRILGIRILVLAHSNYTVNFLLERMIGQNSSITQKGVIRLGRSPPKLQSIAEGYHERTKYREVLKETINRVEKQMNSGSNTPIKELQKQWCNYLREHDEDIFRRVNLNSACVMFSTLNGLSYYFRHELLDLDSPFDKLLIDESSNMTFAEFLLVAPYSRSWAIAGDRSLIQPYKKFFRQSHWDNDESKLHECEEQIRRPTGALLSNLTQKFFLDYQAYLTFNYRLPEVMVNLFNSAFGRMFERYNQNEIEKVKDSEIQNPIILPRDSFSIDDSIHFIVTDNHYPDSGDSVDEDRNISNKFEIQRIIEDVKEIIQANHSQRDDGESFEIWITSLYPSQVIELKNQFESDEDLRAFLKREKYQEKLPFQIEISTVRGFEGNQADVVIWSLTRAPEELMGIRKKIDFDENIEPRYLASFYDPHYMLSLLTRFRQHLIIIGTQKLLQYVYEDIYCLYENDIDDFEFHKHSYEDRFRLCVGKLLELIDENSDKKYL